MASLIVASAAFRSVEYYDGLWSDKYVKIDFCLLSLPHQSICKSRNIKETADNGNDDKISTADRMVII